MGRFIAEREKFHSNLLGLHVQNGNWMTDDAIRQMTAGALAKSSGLTQATGRAVEIMGERIRLQAYTLSLNDGFYLVACGCAVALLFVAVLRQSPLKFGDLRTIQRLLISQKESK